MARDFFKVLTIAGTDPLGGAGVIADALTIHEGGGVPMAVETAFVEQDSYGIRGFTVSPIAVFRERIAMAFNDGRPHAVKVGMLGSAGLAAELKPHLDTFRIGPTRIVLDPVLAGGGPNTGNLGEANLVEALRRLLAPGILVTPNVHELAQLLDRPEATTRRELAVQALQLAATSGATVLATGGHLDAKGFDCIVDGTNVEWFEPTSVWDEDVHGTGCVLSSAIATCLARGSSPRHAVASAKSYLNTAVLAGRAVRIGLGRPQIVHLSD